MKRRALRDGAIALGLAILAAILAGRASSMRDVSVDLALGAPSVPSPEAIDLLRTTSVRATLFFSATDEVLPLASRYFDNAQRSVPGLVVEVRDFARFPVRAGELAVSRNGQIALDLPDGRHDVIEIGVEREGARIRLRDLDASVREVLSRLVRRPVTLAVVRGHGEASDDGEGAHGIGAALRLARSAGLSARSVTLADLDDLVRQEPRLVVLVAGPAHPLDAEEQDALARFVEQGGRAMIALSPDADHGLAPVLLRLGLELSPGVVASERAHLRLASDVSDRALLRADPFGVHPSVASLTESGGIGVVVSRSAALSLREPDGVEVTPTVWSPDSAFVDRDGDLTRDAAEPEGRFMLAAAVVHGDGRAIVVSSVDTLSDRLFAEGGNALLFADGVRWLLGEGEESIARTTPDRPLTLTEDEERIAFHVTTLLVPGACVVVAVVVARRRRRRA